ncbi:uncharacterized protein LOC128232956 isoform X2 [Mya arenaria]|nr:uncharacterized protein LOC128232956 isoform X2 [Mya arenaria]
MAEQTYGWYPSAKNVYEDRRLDTLTPYQLEALYRYRDSKYYTAPATPPEQRTPKPPRPSPSPAARPQSTGSKAGSSSHQGKLAFRVGSAPIHTTYRPPPRLNLPTPQQCWSTHVPQTEITVQPPQPSPAPSQQPMYTRPTPSPQAVISSPVPSPKGKAVRVQSATVRRHTPSKPQRPVKSAGSFRPSPSPVQSPPVPPPTPPAFCTWPHPQADLDYPNGYNQFPDRVILSPERPPAPSPVVSDRSVQRRVSSRGSVGKPPSGRNTPLRPRAPSPQTMELHLQVEGERCETPDYFEETRKHGWPMEVHGDPLKIKKVARRLPYTVKLPEPETERDPPKVHMENNETFFLNTIPRRPMAFAVDKEWISEVINKKRQEMQKKQGGIHYRYKNFAFVY